MSITRISAPSALPTAQSDYVAQNSLIDALSLAIHQKPIWDDSGNVKKGNIIQLGGTIYYVDADTAIGGVSSDYIKLTPSGDGSSCSADYVADLTGVTWNDAYNGYYDVSGNLYVFDEYNALIDGEIATIYTKFWKAFETFLTLDNTFSGDNTFSEEIIANGGIQLDGSHTIKVKVIDIGDWNMNFSVDGSQTKNVAHGLTDTDIRAVNVTIRKDVEDGTKTDFSSCIYEDGYIAWGNTFVYLKIDTTAATYDNEYWNATSYNRGWITILYEV